MIVTNTNGNGFRGVLEYNLAKDKGHIIGHENMMGNDARALSAEFGVIRRLNQKVQTPVYHVSLSLADDERLEDRQWLDLGRQYMHGMGFTDNQAVFFRHHDAEHDHMHIVNARAGMNRQLPSSDNLIDCVPRARGDEPNQILKNQIFLSCSPRAWG